MPTPSKSLDNMSKHLTKDEIEARTQAEADVLPHRKIKRPTRISKDPGAKRYWAAVLKDMDGIKILDALDANTLAIYCEKCARRDEMQAYYQKLRSQYAEDPDNATIRLMIKLDAEIKGSEDAILTYAGKLGLTPESRNRLAKRLAEQEDDDPDADLFA